MAEQSITLLELNTRIKKSINQEFSDNYWIIAEISEMHQNKSGHCYLELIEKDSEDISIAARAKATIWNSTYRILKAYFETSTGRELDSGLKILFYASIEFHELYGFSLNIKDIDPTYTMGDLEKKRQEIIHRLEKEGVIDMNKSLDIPLVPQKIALISSDTAAGYGDFTKQIENNIYNYQFHIKLFPAVMQGDQAESSIISALEKIFMRESEYDLVMIIRGGGSKADLSCFDSYCLSLNVAQFPLPVITGIGHERDESITDIVAHTKTKTPTAAAEFLIIRFANFEADLVQSQEKIIKQAEQIIKEEKIRIENHQIDIRQFCTLFNERNINLLNKLEEELLAAIKEYISNKKHELELFEKSTGFLDPQLILKRGFSITTKNGKVIKSKTGIFLNDILITKLSDGDITTRVVKE